MQNEISDQELIDQAKLFYQKLNDLNILNDYSPKITKAEVRKNMVWLYCKKEMLAYFKYNNTHFIYDWHGKIITRKLKFQNI